MAISKIIYKSSPQATGEVWMDATTATAAAENIIAPYTAMLSNGIVTTGTGSGGGSADLGTKSISSNGTYNASSDNLDGYSQVTVNVPNSYSSSDEGKVVSNGALVAQTSDTVTANGTVDTTLISSLLVNVPTGGGITAATGVITVSSAIASPSATESKTFPGLALDFQPDFLWISMKRDSYLDITTPTNNVYAMMAMKKSLAPVFRWTSNTSTELYNGDYLFMCWRSVSTDTSVSNGYAVQNGCSMPDTTRYPYWSVNANGTFSYGRYGSSGTTPIPAGTFQYFAFKL